MKRFYCLLFLQIFFLNNLIAQDVVMTDEQFARCSGNLFDPGGSGNYANNLHVETTICSSDNNAKIRLTFLEFQLGSGDRINLYQGLSSSSPWIGEFDQNNPPGNIESSSYGGCITIVFDSDGQGVSSGFKASMTCHYPCQQVISTLETSTPPFMEGVILGCVGQLISLTGGATFPNNGVTYSQNIATSQFNWDFGNGQFSQGKSTSYTYDEPGLYNLNLQVTDINGCVSTNGLFVKLKISAESTFKGTTMQDDTICLGNSNTLYGRSQTTQVAVACQDAVSDTTPLPDGVGITYSTTIPFSCFDENAVITSENDIKSVCFDLEHSYINDLHVMLSCPNGTTVTFFLNGTANGEIYLGEPVDNDASDTYGNPYTYCFKNGASETWRDASFTSVQMVTYIDNDGDPTYGNVLPEGDYLPSESFSSFVGCPMNGNWTISISDNLASDNGVIFNWTVKFDDDLYSNSQYFEPEIVDSFWVDVPTVISQTNGEALVIPTTLGTNCYTFVSVNSFGCEYDTTICFEVIPGEDSNFDYGKEVFCDNADNLTPITQMVGGRFSALPTGIDVDSITGEINFSNSVTGDYTIKHTSPGVEQCQTSTNKNVKIVEIPSARLSGIDSICQGQKGVLNVDFTGVSPWDISYSKGGQIYKKLNITTSPYSLEINTSGDYILVGMSNDGCQGTVAGNGSIFMFEDTAAKCKDPFYTVTYVDENLYWFIPNSFTPNGDDVNNVFMPILASGFDITSYELAVFDRWGKVVFLSKDVEVGWDGALANNEKASSGIYTYVVSFDGIKPAIQVQKKGTVALMR